MSDIETTEMKLRTTPTAGVAGEHSPYYRRLLSAGYKGFLQGTIGGAGLYGFFGLAIGAVLAIPVMMIPGVGIGALALIPAMGGVGVIKGANTFGNIGSVAAISAESADLAEQRRYLLDRYYELPEGPEGDKQAEIIKQELTRQNAPEEGRHVFHWKTVLLCAAIGAGLALCFLIPGGPLIGIVEHTALGSAIAPIEAVLGTLGLKALTVIAGTGVGALAGVTAGIDRSYIRRWFDSSEKLLHDDSHAMDATIARAQQVERIKGAAAIDEETKRIIERRNVLPDADEHAFAKPAPHSASIQQPIASLDKPETKVSSATLHNRLADIQQAMANPVL